MKNCQFHSVLMLPALPKKNQGNAGNIKTEMSHQSIFEYKFSYNIPQPFD